MSLPLCHMLRDLTDGLWYLSLSNSTRGIYAASLNFEASQFHQYMYHHVYKDSLVSLKKNKNLYFFPHTIFCGFQFYMFDVLAAIGYE